jgi:glucose dehydrogenase
MAPFTTRQALIVLGSAALAALFQPVPAADGGAASVAAPPLSWPQFRGPHRDGRSEETGLLSSWPQGGPALLWKCSTVGFGYSSPIVVGDAIYATCDAGESLEILALALDLEGKERWRVKNGARWKNPWPGSRSSVTWKDGRLYHMNAHGRLVCLEAANGREVWAVEVLECFGAKNVMWGQSESLLVEGERIFLTVAGSKALLAALDRATGETVWTSPPLAEEKCAYSSTILVPVGALRVLVNAGSRHAFGVDADTGKVLWTHRHQVPENVLGAAPFALGDSVYITNSSRDASTLYRLRLAKDGAGATQVWARDVKNGQGGLVLAEGRLWGANGDPNALGIVAIDPAEGTVTRVPGDLGFGALIQAEGRLDFLGQEGEAALLRPTADGAEIVGRFRLVDAAKKKDAWAHPVLAGGRLFLRYHETLWCYDVRRAGGSAAAGEKQ